MKNIVLIIILIFILIMIPFFIIIYNANHQTIIDGIATITKKKQINEFNLKYEQFYGINNSEDIKILLQQCMDNYLYYHEEPIKIPVVKFVTDKGEMILEYYQYKDFYTKEEETEYYIGLNNILENILLDKSYKVEFKYSTYIVDEVSLIGEIEITECDEEPEKFDIKDLEKNRVYVEDKTKEERNIEKVNIEVEENSISKTGATIIVTDNNKIPYTWNETYSIE